MALALAHVLNAPRRTVAEQVIRTTTNLTPARFWQIALRLGSHPGALQLAPAAFRLHATRIAAARAAR